MQFLLRPGARMSITRFNSSRRTALSFLVALSLVVSLPANAQATSQTVRIGYQKSSTLLTIIKTRGTPLYAQIA
jgi:sulfonate transport system substrate-binding protein